MVRGNLQTKLRFIFFFPSSNFNELENAKQNIYIGENRRDRAFFYIHFVLRSKIRDIFPKPLHRCFLSLAINSESLKK